MKFLLKIFPVWEPRPDGSAHLLDGRTSAASNFHTKASSVRTMRMAVQTVDLLHAISFSDERASERESTSSGRLSFELWFLPYGWARLDGNPHCPDDWINLPLFKLAKNLKLIDHWEASEQKLEQKLLEIVKGSDGNPRRPDGWCFRLKGVRTEWHIVRTAGRPDRMTRHPDGWQGTEIFCLVSSAESSETLLNSGIPVKKHIYIQVILSNRMRPITN
jgi:hypothetical protein